MIEKDEEIRRLIINNKAILANFDNYKTKINSLELDNTNLSTELRQKDEYFQSELDKLEKLYESYKLKEEGKSESERNSHSQTRNKVNDLESKQIIIFLINIIL